MRISDWSSDVCSSDLWYNGGYRANIVAYTLAVLGDITKRRKESIDFLGIWNAQKVDPVLESAIAVVSGVVNDDIIRPPQGISNISEWCKKEACWTRIQARTDAIENGRASCRERVGQYVLLWVVVVPLKKKKNT